MPFAKPAPPGEGIKWADLNGCLLIVDVGRLEVGIPTTFGDADAVRANVTALDGPAAGQVWEDSLVFPRVLVGQLKTLEGQMVLGRLTQGAAKPGQSPPWRLSDPTDGDQAVATAYIAGRVTAPAAPARGDTDAPF